VRHRVVIARATGAWPADRERRDACYPGPSMRVAVVLALSLAVALPARGEGESNFVLRDVTRGVTVPTALGVAGDFDVSAAIVNPAGLATLGGFSAGFASTNLESDRTVRGGGGWGAFVALPIQLRMRDGDPFRLTYGFSWQSIASPATWTGTPVPGRPTPYSYDATYFVNGIGVGTNRVSVGWTVANVVWARTPDSQGTTTHHVGINLRPSRFLSLGLVLRDVFQPAGRSENERFSRATDSELSLRPLGDWRLELAGGVLAGSDDLFDWRARALLRPWPGVTVFGLFESVRRSFGGPGLPETRDSRVMAGVSLDLRIGQRQETVGASFATLTSGKGAGSPYAGTSVFVHFTDERFPSFVEPSRFERVEVEGDIDEREHLATLLQLEELGRSGEIKGVMLVIGPSNLGWGRTEEMREAVARLRARGKRVVAYLKDAGMRQYYLATAAERVLLHPTATVGLHGIAAIELYARNLLDRLGVGVQVLQLFEYKSAGEMLTRTSPSAAAREEVMSYLADVYGRFAATVSRERQIAPDRLQAIVERPGLTPPEARQERLVDEIAYEDQVDGMMSKQLGFPVSVSRSRAAAKRPTQWSAPQIAVVHVSGEIVDQPSAGGVLSSALGAPEVAEAIRDARESPRVGAIVLRVDSPGGMVQPSEEISREVERTRGRKPIIVSIGDVAASGGYWVAAPADAIFAPPSALTGSIGVVGVRLDMAGLAAKVGLTSEILKIGGHADAENPFRSWTPEEEAAQFAEMKYVYDCFVERVAVGRHLDRGVVEGLARGRVWSGEQARQRGLVDRLAGLAAALEEAKRRSGLPDRTSVQVISLPLDRRGVVQQLLAEPADPLQTRAAVLPPSLRAVLDAVPKVLWYPRAPLIRFPWAEALLDAGK
jgi:protease-4